MRRRELLWGAGALSLIAMSGCQITATPVAADEAGVEAAFFYAFPLYEIARTGQNRAAQPGLNKLGHRAVLADHTMRAITAPNNDTVYSSGQLDLSGGPLEVSAPTDLHRYFNITFMDAFTDNFAGIGTRLTGGKGVQVIYDGVAKDTFDKGLDCLAPRGRMIRPFRKSMQQPNWRLLRPRPAIPS